MENIVPYFKINHTQKGIYDIELQNLDKLRNFSSVESHILLYPFSRNVTSDNITCNPFQEYVEDIRDGFASTYSKISFVFNNILGLVMAVIIFLLFLIFVPSAFLSIDSVVAIFAAYIIGKELGDDLELFLVNLSSKWRIQFYKDYFKYKLERATSLTNYTSYAKKYRYGKDSILPNKMDFDKRSNSDIVRLKFRKEDLGVENTAHILSLRISDKSIKDFEKEGYMVGFKLCFNEEKKFYIKSHEIFQSFFKGNVGCLNSENKFVKNNVYIREVFKRGRIKYNSRKGIAKGRIIAK